MGNSGRPSAVNFPMPSVFSYMVQIYGSDHGLRDVCMTVRLYKYYFPRERVFPLDSRASIVFPARA